MRGTRKKLKFLLALTLVILLAFGTAITAFGSVPQDPPTTKPTNCPPTSIETGNQLGNYTYGPGQQTYPGLGASDILPDGNLTLLAGCDVGYLKVDKGPGGFQDDYYYAGKDGNVKGTSGGFWAYIWKNQDNTFTWKSNYPVYYVYAKGGDGGGGNLYLYANGSYCGTGLSQPSGSGWSHINFYYCSSTPPPPTVSLVVYKAGESIGNESFTVYLKQQDGTPVGSKPFSKNAAATFPGLTAGATYEIGESGLGAGYSLEGITGVGVTITPATLTTPWYVTIPALAAGGTVYVTIENSYQDDDTVTLVVYKEFETGYAGSSTHLFPVTLIPVPVNGDSQLYALNGTENGGISGAVSVNDPWEVTADYPELTPGWYEIIEVPGNCQWVRVYSDLTDGVDQDVETGQWFVLIPESGSVAITLVNRCEGEQEYGTLIVRKQILNGGSTTLGFGFTVSGTEIADTVSAGTFKTYQLEPGNYTVLEDALPATSAYQYYSIVTGSVSVTVVAGQTVEAVLVNRYDPPFIVTYTPAITITKTGPATAEEGEVITYSFTVRNTGETTLTNVQVTDPLFGATWVHNIGTLNVGQAVTFTQTYTIPEGTAGTTIPNTATVTGNYGSTVVSSSANHSVVVLQEFPPEPPGGDEEEEEPELPRTSGNDMLLLAMAAVLAGSGLALRRKRK